MGGCFITNLVWEDKQIALINRNHKIDIFKVSLAPMVANVHAQHKIVMSPWAKFQPNWTKDREARILTWTDTLNCSVTSYSGQNEEVIKLFMFWRDFVPEYHSAKFGGN